MTVQREICRALGKPDYWLYGTRNHKRKIESLYGELSLDAVEKYIMYQFNLANMLVKSLEYRLITLSEARDVLYGNYAHVSQVSKFLDVCMTLDPHEKLMNINRLERLEKLNLYLRSKMRYIDEITLESQ